ncbi:NUDIX hydrolase [Methylopila musalis]|uniref:NUDIX hydrolase n=1 Tax=Methylopila musalis TaxID=1134781 RepID=A0ABW3Z4K4_9HYPH
MSEARVVAVAGFGGRVTPGPLAVDVTEAPAIAANFAVEKARKPKIFDGRVLLAERVAIEDGRLTADYAETGFSTFLWWRAQGFPERGVRNVFGAAAVVSSDGAALLGRMAPHTANAGKIYFPAGTPDRDDLRGEAVDIEGSILRELWEETGLEPPLVTPTDERFVVFAGHLVACVRRFDCALTAVELRERVEATLRAQAEPEFDAVVLARSAADLTGPTLSYVPAALERLLGP